ncbi:hypothetical protein AK812_SmicGene24723 [Symbiodinium microadriaticum]|uniref:Uncharacterized protein n=1 Tax=Symbiodinium microadriaticum TaxID=2951 RepID=A0A1Q9DEA0_SYMMI|nr:hypothetical protein AK812_SmicGene24723 [Symbiodinium microadriaticum]
MPQTWPPAALPRHVISHRRCCACPANPGSISLPGLCPSALPFRSRKFHRRGRHERAKRLEGVDEGNANLPFAEGEEAQQVDQPHFLYLHMRKFHRRGRHERAKRLEGVDEGNANLPFAEGEEGAEPEGSNAASRVGEDLAALPDAGAT